MTRRRGDIPAVVAHPRDRSRVRISLEYTSTLPEMFVYLQISRFNSAIVREFLGFRSCSC